MSCLSTIHSRRMIRRYTAQPVEPATVRALLEAAVRAPSPHNRQPWRFAVVTGPARARLARAMGDRLRADLLRDGVPAEVAEQDTSRSYQRITSAPVVLLACLSMADMDHYPDARRNTAEFHMAAQAVAAAVENLLLAAQEMGLGACWMCAPLFCPDVVASTLQLPGDWQPQALVTLGHPADTGKDRGRRDVDDVTCYID
jgi:coenzyme F420-0:L-glutamate ligase / coenzyme F420-1:gamma-L-glutamate ligase